MPPPARRRTVSPPPGVSPRRRGVPPCASARPRATARPSPTPVGPDGVADPSGTARTSVSQLVRHPRAVVDDAQGAPGPPEVMPDTSTAPSVCRTALPSRLASTRSSRPASHRGRRAAVARDPHARARRGTPTSAAATTSSSGTSLASTGSTAPVWSRLMSSRSTTIAAQPCGWTPRWPRAARHGPRRSSRVVVASRRVPSRRPHAGQRGAQVVRDRGEQRRTRAVARLELAGRGGLAGQLLALAEHPEVGGEGGQDAPVGGSEATRRAAPAAHAAGAACSGVRRVGHRPAPPDQLGGLGAEGLRTSSSSRGTSYSPRAPSG